MATADIISATRPERRVASTGQSSARLACAGAFALPALIADSTGGFGPLVFAAVLILGIGLPHGASDHLAAMGKRGMRDAPGRLVGFLGLYLAAVATTLLMWHWAPVAMLAGFLALSAIHFAVDDVADGLRLGERVARGLMPVTLPALLHTDSLGGLFATLSTPMGGRLLAEIASFLDLPVLGLTLLAALLRWRQEDHDQATELVLSAVALVVFSPLVGFALVFALVHSRGQTRERMAGLGLRSLRSYLRRCAPTLLGATLLFGGLAALLAEGRAPGLGALFIGLSALTVPHMLVTPLFERNARSRDPRSPARS